MALELGLVYVFLEIVYALELLGFLPLLHKVYKIISIQTLEMSVFIH